MKNIYILLITFISIHAFSQVGIGTSTPKGALDVTSSTMGIVYPQVTLTDRVTETITNPNGGSIVVGTTVYNTTISGSGVNTVYPGIYIWDGSIWIPQYHKDDYKLCYQTTDVRPASSSGNQTITFDTNSFTPKFNGNYLVTVTVHYGGGLLDAPAGIDQWVNFNAEEGQFDFTFNGNTHSHTVKTFSGYNDDKLFDGGSTNNHTNRYNQQTFTIPVSLVRNTTYPFTLTFNQAVANGFQDDGNNSSGDGRGYITINNMVKCTVEFNYNGI